MVLESHVVTSAMNSTASVY